MLDHAPKIIPELCSGCPKCVQYCPMDCIYEDNDSAEAITPESLWRKVEAREGKN